MFKVIIIAMVVVAVLFLIVGVLAERALASQEDSFLAEINRERSAAGLEPLIADSRLSAYARAHSLQMHDDGNIYHSANLGSAMSGWEGIAENVGAGPTVDSLHNAFMDSPGHRANVLGDFNLAGVGVTNGIDGKIWVTVIFARVLVNTFVAEPITTTAVDTPVESTMAPEPRAETVNSLERVMYMDEWFYKKGSLLCK